MIYLSKGVESVEYSFQVADELDTNLVTDDSIHCRLAQLVLKVLPDNIR